MTKNQCRRKFYRAARLFSPLAALALGGCARLDVLDPVGPVGAQEKFLILLALGLMLIVVVPVWIMAFVFAWHYRASNKRATYAPHWHTSHGIELVTWGVSAAIVAGLAILSWKASHALDPYKPLVAAEKPVDVDAVAMNWKWLFIYPRLHIASVNELVLPTDAPASIRLTSTTVMTAFFVPRFGSMIYAMPGMRTKMHLLADKPGIYEGRNYQYSGGGYSWMHFKVRVTSLKSFDAWVHEVRRSPRTLDQAALSRLEKPSRDVPVSVYASVPPHLFDSIIASVRGPATAAKTVAAIAGPTKPQVSRGA